MKVRSRSSLAWRRENASSSRSSMPVERDPEPADLRARVGRLDAVGEVAAGDPARGVAHAVEREQADPHDDPAGDPEQQQHGADHERLDEQQPVELLVGLAQRDGGDQRCRRARGSRWASTR